MPRIDKARIAIAVFFFINGAVVGCWVPYIPERAHALGLSAGQLGTTLLGAGFGAVMAMPLAGRLVPRLGSRAVSTVTGVGFTLAFLTAVTAQARGGLLAALVVSGVCGASMDIAMNAQAVVVENRSGKRILSSLHGLYSLGNVVGSFGVSAAFARHAPHGLLALCLSIALAAVLLSSAPFLMIEQTSPQLPTRARSSVASRLLLLGSFVIAAMVCEGGTADWSGIYLRDGRGLGPGWAGVGFAVFSTLMLMGRLLGDRIVARWGEVRVLRLGGLLAALGAALVVFGSGAYAPLLGFAVFGAGLANVSPVLYRAAGQVPGIPAGVGLATAVGMGYTGLLAGPPALGYVGQAFGLQAIFLVIAVLALLLGISAGKTAVNA